MAEEQKPSYLREWLTSQTNVYAFLASTGAAAVLSIPFGFGIGAVPLIAFAAGDIIASMFIPSLPITFATRSTGVSATGAQDARNGTCSTKSRSDRRTASSTTGP
jgi:hypothetical protein